MKDDCDTTLYSSLCFIGLKSSQAYFWLQGASLELIGVKGHGEIRFTNELLWERDSFSIDNFAKDHKRSGSFLILSHGGQKKRR